MRPFKYIQALSSSHHIDPRKFQIVYLGFFLLLGTFYLDWGTEAGKVILVMGTALLVQSLAGLFGRVHPQSWMSALITALGICLLFRANDATTLMLAAALAIGSKFILRIKQKHLFNPANFGIIMAMLLTPDGWVSPGQWGSSAVLFFMLAVLGSIVLLKVGRLDTTLTFFLVFVALEYCRTILYLGWSHDVLLHKLTNGSFLLFAFFMITDPKTTPDHPRSRKIWASTLAVFAFMLSTQLYIHTAPLWALFFITPLNAILDHFWKHSRFFWSSERGLNSPIT